MVLIGTPPAAATPTLEPRTLRLVVVTSQVSVELPAGASVVGWQYDPAQAHAVVLVVQERGMPRRVRKRGQKEA